MTESDEDRGAGYAIIYFGISLTLGFACLFLSYFHEELLILGVILIVTCPIMTVMLSLAPMFLPKAKKAKENVSERITVRTPSRRIFVGVLGVTALFLVVLFWMVQSEFVRTSEAIVIAVFSIIFQVILYAVTEMARKR